MARVTPIPISRFIGIIFAVLGCAINTLFYYRMPGISVSHYVAQFAAYPCGKYMARWLPTREFNLFGWKFTLNPGPFNQKEHILISVMTSVSFGGAYVTDVFVVQRLKMFYNQNTLGGRAGYQILLALSTQLVGYGMYVLVDSRNDSSANPHSRLCWNNAKDFGISCSGTCFQEKWCIRVVLNSLDDLALEPCGYSLE